MKKILSIDCDCLFIKISTEEQTKMSYKIFFLLALAALSSVVSLADGEEGLKFRQCAGAKIKSLNIRGCGSEHCNFKVGHEYLFEATFIPSLTLTKPIISLKSQRGLLDHSKADWGVEVPALKGQEQHVAYKFTFDTAEPLGLMKFTVEDEGEWPNFCVEFSAQIEL